MTKSRNILAPRRHWSVADEAILRARYPDEQAAVIAADMGRKVGSVYQHAAKLGLHKSEQFMASERSGRVLRGKLSAAMKATQFKKGQIPVNKGLRRPGWAPGRMRDTQFKPGERRGVAVKLYQPVGTERISKDGYLERKVNDDLPRQRRWRAVHLVLWEAANGPMPRGHCLAFRDGNKQHIALDNLDLITRAERMRRNTIHRYPPELKQTIRLVGKLKRTIEARREEQA